MPDWRRMVEQRMARLRLTVEARQEVWTELSDHLEDLHGQLLGSGISEEEATRKTLEFVSKWKAVERGIERAREGSMSAFGKQFILPSGIALALATCALALEIRLGPRPTVWNFDRGALVIYRLWPIALFITGAISAYLAMRAGARRSRRVLVAITPALYMLGAMFCVLAVIMSNRLLRWMPPQPIYWMAFLMGLANWVALPAIALLLGAIPFLGQSAEQNHVVSGD
jgi:hypothetical protein